MFRNAQTRWAKGANGNNSMSSRRRSPWAVRAAVREIRLMCSKRRRMLLASTIANSGPARASRPITDSAHRPSSPESTSAATKTDASSTVVMCGPRHALEGCVKVLLAFLPMPCGRELSATKLQWRDATRSAPVRSEGILAWIDVEVRRGSQARHELLRGHLLS